MFKPGDKVTVLRSEADEDFRVGVVFTVERCFMADGVPGMTLREYRLKKFELGLDQRDFRKVVRCKSTETGVAELKELLGARAPDAETDTLSTERKSDG